MEFSPHFDLIIEEETQDFSNVNTPLACLITSRWTIILFRCWTIIQVLVVVGHHLG